MYTFHPTKRTSFLGVHASCSLFMFLNVSHLFATGSLLLVGGAKINEQWPLPWLSFLGVKLQGVGTDVGDGWCLGASDPHGHGHGHSTPVPSDGFLLGGRARWVASWLWSFTFLRRCYQNKHSCDRTSDFRRVPVGGQSERGWLWSFIFLRWCYQNKHSCDRVCDRVGK